MADSSASLLARLRQPAYTGENRCIPCTAVNLGIALVLTVIAGFLAIGLAVIVFLVSVLAIALRGYLVPGTPALTKRYLPDSILARFDKHPAAASGPASSHARGGGSKLGEGGSSESSDDGGEWETLQKLEDRKRNSVDPDGFLADVGAIVEASRTDRTVTDAFAAELRAEVAAVREAGLDTASLAPLFEVAAEELSSVDREYPAYRVGNRIRKWPSEAAMMADVAIHRAMAARTDRWAGVPYEQRLDIIESLRTHLETCPACEGPLEETSETVESCCRTFEVYAERCVDCGDHLREYEPTKADTANFTR
jgi:hypothetical protein